MADYIYLLENRLSPAQRNALQTVRDLVRAKNLTVFLVGGAVRDLTSGSPVRDLDLAVQGEAPKLKADLEKAGAVVTGESKPGQALFLRFPGNVRMEIGSTLSATYPKPGKPVLKPAAILDDLRRRDFTANAMALSLNAGSYGLLMDPLNGVADIENRELRLVSNYGFIEDPVRMIRAARFMARLGWNLEEKTEARYQTGKQEGYIATLSDFARGYETEEIVHEEDPLRVLRRLESEGWMKILAPVWISAKVNVAELERLRETQTQLQLQGIHPDTAAISFPLLTAKLSAAEVAMLKKSFPRQGFVAEIDQLDADTKELAAQLAGKATALPSQAWKLLTSARPEIVLSVAFATKNASVQSKFKSFSSDWPQARQKIPHTLLQEMRIVPELQGYNDLLETLYFRLMDGQLSTPEEMKAFLEPYSPPAPPPPVNLRRARAAAKKQAKSKSRSKRSAAGDDAIELDPDSQDSPDSQDAVELDHDTVELDHDTVELDREPAGNDVEAEDLEAEQPQTSTAAQVEEEDEAGVPPQPVVPLSIAAKKKTVALPPESPAVAAKTVPAKLSKVKIPRPSASSPKETPAPAAVPTQIATPPKAAPKAASPESPRPKPAQPKVAAAPQKLPAAKAAAPPKLAPARTPTAKAVPAKATPAKQATPAKKLVAPAKKAAAAPAKAAPAKLVKQPASPPKKR